MAGRLAQKACTDAAHLGFRDWCGWWGRPLLLLGFGSLLVLACMMSLILNTGAHCWPADMTLQHMSFAGARLLLQGLAICGCLQETRALSARPACRWRVDGSGGSLLQLTATKPLKCLPAGLLGTALAGGLVPVAPLGAALPAGALPPSGTPLRTPGLCQNARFRLIRNEAHQPLLTCSAPLAREGSG